MIQDISVYFHIPFCTKKCPYCHFYVIPNRLAFHSLLAEGLKKEWQSKNSLLETKNIVSVYFGGGTPSLFGPQQISQILERLPLSSTEREITLEANPDEITPELLLQYRQIGINRLSLGVQSLDDRSLQTLERAHSAARAKEAIWSAHRAGFTNISIDLMYDLPGQTEASFQCTLDSLSQLPIEHASLYNLTIEPHTAFYKRRERLLPLFPSQELSVRLLQMAIESLEKMGLSRYEISAFGRPSVHNSGYWTGRPFLGFGPSAYSFWGNKRFRNVANLQRYSRALKEGRSPVDFEEQLPYPDNVKELLAVRLRLTEGVDLIEWNLPLETQQALHRLRQQGFVQQRHTTWQLTERGMLFYDTVATELI